MDIINGVNEEGLTVVPHDGKMYIYKYVYCDFYISLIHPLASVPTIYSQHTQYTTIIYTFMCMDKTSSRVHYTYSRIRERKDHVNTLKR